MESEKGSEFRERGSVFKQMAEMKKKIQLVEGERKAIFEDCESEKQTPKTKKSPLKNQKITPINQKIIFSIFEPKSWFCLSVHNLSSNPPENAKFD